MSKTMSGTDIGALADRILQNVNLVESFAGARRTIGDQFIAASERYKSRDELRAEIITALSTLAAEKAELERRIAEMTRVLEYYANGPFGERAQAILASGESNAEGE